MIWSEVAYTYTPAIGYMVAKTGMTFRDAAYTRPRTVPVLYIRRVPAHLSEAVTAALDKLPTCTVHRDPLGRGSATIPGLRWFSFGKGGLDPLHWKAAPYSSLTSNAGCVQTLD